MRVFVIILWCGVMTNHFGSSFLYIDLQYEQMNEYINSLVGSFVKVSTAAQLFNINPAKDVCVNLKFDQPVGFKNIYSISHRELYLVRLLSQGLLISVRWIQIIRDLNL